MATYGRYETVKQLHSGTLTTVSSATLSGQKSSGAAPYIVKTFNASREMLDPVGRPGSHELFIICVASDAAVADAVGARLERDGLRCRQSPRNVPVGGASSTAALDDILASHSVVLILSARADDSDAVGREADYAASNGIPIHVFRIDDSEATGQLEQALPNARWVDARAKPLDKHLDTLADHVRDDLRGRGLLTSGGEALRATDFLELAKLQRQLIDKGAEHWAPIHDIGTGPTGPYFITDNYKRNAQQLIKFRVPPKPLRMYLIVHSVLLGLDELKKLGGRAHGNLKPSNVMLSGSKRQLKVYLTDLGAASIHTREAQAEDMRAVGELIYQLVLHEKPPAVVQTVPLSDAWTRLRHGEKWRELCSTLLNPPAGAEPSRATVIEQVEGLRPRRSPVRFAVYATLAVLVIATALIIPVYRAYRNVWNQLVAQESWLNEIEPYLRLTSELEPEKSAWRTRIKSASNDDYLKALVAKWEDPSGPYSRQNLPLTPQQIREISTYPPISPGAMHKVRKALDAAAELRADLNERWPKVARLKQTGQRFRERGWEIPAKQLLATISLEGSSQPRAPGAEPVAVQDAIRSIWEDYPAVDPVIRQIDDGWDAVQRHNQKLVATDDKLLIKYLSGLNVSFAFNNDFVPMRLSDMRQPLQEIEVPLNDWADVGERLVAAVETDKWKLINREEFNKSPAHQSAVASLIIFRQWIGYFDQARVQRPVLLPPNWMPRDLLAAQQRLPTLKELAKKAANFKDAPDTVGPPPAVDIQARDDAFKALNQQLASLQAAQAANVSADAFKVQLQAFEKRSRDLLASLDNDIGTANVWLAKAEDAHEMQLAAEREARAQQIAAAKDEKQKMQAENELAENDRKEGVEKLLREAHAAIEGVESKAIQDAWIAQVDVIEQSPAAPQLAVADLKNQLDELKAHMKSLDARMPRLKLVPPRDQDWQREAAEILEQYAAATREKRLEEFAKKTVRDARPVSPKDPVLEGFNKVALDSGQWNEKAQAFINAYDLIKRRLDEAYLLEEPVPSGLTLQELADQWQNSELLKVSFNNRTVRDAVEPALGPLNGLTTLLAKGTRDAGNGLRERLTAAVESPTPSIQRKAWRALRQLNPPWPATRAELEDEANFIGLLDAQFASIEQTINPSRGATLKSQLSVEGPQTLRDFFNRATEPTQLAEAASFLNAARLNQFKVASGDIDKFLITVDRRTRFGIERLKFSDAVAKMSNDEKSEVVRPQIKRFVDRFQNLVSADKTEAADDLYYFNKELTPYRDLLKAESGPSSGGNAAVSNAVGPSGPAVSLKWTQKSVDDSLEFTGPGNRKLKFVRLNSTNTYLCTDEVSIGLFLEVTKQSGKQDMMRSLLYRPSKDVVSEDQRAGPRVWEWQPGTNVINVARDWLRVDTRKNPPFQTPGPKPAADHPMQYLSVGAAAYFAYVMNCRLPTVDEWQAAYGVAQRTPTTWNLRDNTWNAQHQYVAGLFRGDPKLEFPDAGVFPQGEGIKASLGPAPDDGVLYFADVGESVGQPFRHIVGNVAEYVVDAPKEWYQSMGQMNDKKKVTSTFSELFKKEKIAVIGGSAMSNPEVPVNKAQIIKTDVYIATGKGYSDVGMRLALDAAGGAGPPPPAAEPVNIVLVLKQLVKQPPGKTAANRPAESGTVEFAVESPPRPGTVRDSLRPDQVRIVGSQRSSPGRKTPSAPTGSPPKSVPEETVVNDSDTVREVQAEDDQPVLDGEFSGQAVKVDGSSSE